MFSDIDGDFFMLYVRGMCLLGDFESNIDSVQGGGGDASSVASTLATRIEVRRGYRLQCLGIARNTHSTTAAALYAEDNRLVGQETTVLAVEITEALLQAFADMFG